MLNLNQIVAVCSKIIGVQFEDLISIWKKRVVQKAKGIKDQPDHNLSPDF